MDATAAGSTFWPFDPSTGSLLVVEIKTRLNDIGALERQLGWCERLAPNLAADRGWSAGSIRSVVLLLASEEVERTIHTNRHARSVALPVRGDILDPPGTGRGLALIDPRRRRRDWLMRSRLDGRRSAAPYRDYADAAARLGACVTTLPVPLLPASRGRRSTRTSPPSPAR